MTYRQPRPNPTRFNRSINPCRLTDRSKSIVKMTRESVCSGGSPPPPNSPICRFFAFSKTRFLENASVEIRLP